MAIKASEIKDRDSLRDWLKGQPVFVARVIASRAALRVLPIALSIHQDNHPKLTVEIKNDLILQTFRASSLSWIARKYQTHDIKVAAGGAYDAATAAANAAAAAYAARDVAARASAARAAAARTARAARAAADAAAYAARAYAARDVAARSAAARVRAVAAGVRAATATAAAAAANAAAAALGTAHADAGAAHPTARVAADAAAAYTALRTDAESLEGKSDDIYTLISQPLWLEPSDVPENYDDLQQEIKGEFNIFRQSDLAQETSFGLIAEWYVAILSQKGKSRSLFGMKKDIELATQPEAFWEGEAQEVMDRVAELVGWPVDYRNEEDNKTDKDTQVKSEKISKAKAEKVSSNRMVVRFQLSAILNSIAIEKKIIGEQPNEEEKQEDWLKKTQFLEGLDKMANDALDLLPIEPDGTQNEKDDEVASLLSEYAQEFEKWLRKNKPEVVDSVVRLGPSSCLLAVLSIVGVYMPIATPIILGMTCGDKAVNILRVLKSSLSKKKPKDKDE